VKLNDVSSDLIVKYVKMRGRFRSKEHVARVISELRCMGEYLVKEGIWPKNPLRWIRGPKLDGRMRVPRRLNATVIERIWEQCVGSREEHRRYECLALLSVLYGTGLRRGEISRLDVSDWLREEGILKIDGKKGGRERHVPVGPGVWTCIEAYLPRRHNKLERVGRLEEQALFLDKNGHRMNEIAISGLVSRLTKHAGVDHVTLHQFRHSCASDLIEAGISLPEVQAILGHAVIQTTLRYTHVADPARREAMEKHPIQGFLKEEGRGGAYEG
jgi:site-specific recombinase XerD